MNNSALHKKDNEAYFQMLQGELTWEKVKMCYQSFFLPIFSTNRVPPITPLTKHLS